MFYMHSFNLNLHKTKNSIVNDIFFHVKKLNYHNFKQHITRDEKNKRTAYSLSRVEINKKQVIHKQTKLFLLYYRYSIPTVAN